MLAVGGMFWTFLFLKILGFTTLSWWWLPVIFFGGFVGLVIIGTIVAAINKD